MVKNPAEKPRIKFIIDEPIRPRAIYTNGLYLSDIWPTNAQIQSLVHAHVHKEFFESEYAKIFDGDEFWQALEVTESTTFDWDEQSTYIKKPPYFKNFTLDKTRPSDIENAGVLLVLGNSVTTDHISPAGAIPEDYPAGQYLMANHVLPQAFNSYGSRRGNHEVMIRGTFGNIRIKTSWSRQRKAVYRKISHKNRCLSMTPPWNIWRNPNP